MWSQESFIVSSDLAPVKHFLWLSASLFLMKEFRVIAKEVKLFSENNSKVTKCLLVPPLRAGIDLSIRLM